MAFEWQNIHAVPEISAGEMHAWLIKIDHADEDTLVGGLSEYEVKRARSFRMPSRRSEFIVSRGYLRLILGSYLDMSPSSIEFVYSKDGKPGVENAETDLRFNVSHSGGYLLIAFILGAEVGADIECVDMLGIDDGTLKRSLHSNELRRFHALVNNEKDEFFFDCWTRKEAFLKLLGCGFAIEPSEIDLYLGGRNEQGVLGNEVYFTELPPLPGYAASIATSTDPVSARFYMPNSGLLS